MWAGALFLSQNDRMRQEEEIQLADRNRKENVRGRRRSSREKIRSRLEERYQEDA